MKQLRLISSRIRRWREESHYTLQELAHRSGVSPSTIHKIENNQTIPTLSVFIKIAEGLGRKPSELLFVEEMPQGIAITKACDRSTLGEPSGTRIQKIVQDYQNPRIEMWRAIIQPGVLEEQVIAEDEGELIFLCERGSLSMTIDGREMQLQCGDAVHCRASSTRIWRNDGEVPAVVTLCMDLPQRVLPRMGDRIRHVVRNGTDAASQRAAAHL